MRARLLLQIFVLVALSLSLVSCGGGDGNSSSGGGSAAGGESAGYTRQDLTATSDSTGVVRFAFGIESGVGAVQLVAQSSGNSLALTSASGPGGSLLAASVTEATSATSRQSAQNVFNFPTLEHSVADGTYTVTYQTYSGGTQVKAGVPVTVSVLKRSALSSGTLPVNVIYVGPAGNSDNTIQSIEGAVEYWQRIYAKANIALDVKYYNFDGPRVLTDPRVGSTLFTQISSATRPFAYNVLIGVDVSGLSSSNDQIYGLSGSIPGSLLPGPHSVTTFSIIKTAGTDGLYNYDGPGYTQIFDDEVDIAGETLAQLAGEYLGLQPTVTINGNSVIGTDRLDDTQSCVTKVDCYDSKDAHQNFMFPALFYEDNDSRKTFARADVTQDQIDLMLQSPLVQ